MTILTVGIDLAKNVFALQGFGVRSRIQRQDLILSDSQWFSLGTRRRPAAQ